MAETPIEWLRSFLNEAPTHPDDLEQQDIIRQAIAGLMERDTWMPVVAEMAKMLRLPDRHTDSDIIETLRRRLEKMAQMREALRSCARTLQHNLSAWGIKDEQMMLKSLELAWSVIGRGYCERDGKRAWPT